MRLKSMIAMVAAVLALALASPKSAEAFGWHRTAEPAGWSRMRTVRHWVYHPRYHHVYHNHTATDPYAYRYEPRGYYPYYNSHYWRPAHEMRKARAGFVLPTYHRAWGHPKRNYRHVAWHMKKYGGHRRGHW
ncbi:MAG: hypothetical protein ABL908_10685 [Hyphomicrobium sp.]